MSTLVSVFGVEPSRIGGTETFARELSLQLKKLGWNSVLCFLSEPSEPVKNFLSLPNTSFEVLANSTNGSWKAGAGLAGIMERHHPDILHLHFTGFVTVYPWVARLKSVRKVFFTDHHSRAAGYVLAKAPLWKRAAPRLINGPLTKVICVSDFGFRCMTSYGSLPENRFEMIYNGVDLTRVARDPQRGIDFRRRYSIPDERAMVTQVSWIIPEKGIGDFLETARLVLAQDQNVQFVLVGEGQQRQQYMKDAEEMGLGDHVTWTGAIRDPFGEGVFEAADVVCQFSRWEEVFGWMIAEAMAHEKPVVATRVGGIPELVDDGVSGVLVPRGNAAEMSESVLRLLANRELRAEMGTAARAIVDAKFDLRKNVAQLIKSYGIA